MVKFLKKAYNTSVSPERNFVEEFQGLKPREKYIKLLEIIDAVPPVIPDIDPERQEAQNRILALLELYDEADLPANIDIRAEILQLVDNHPDQTTRRVRSPHYQELSLKYKALNSTAPITAPCREFLYQQFEMFYRSGNTRHPQSIAYMLEIANDKDAELRKALTSGPSMHFLLGIDNPNEQEGYFNPKNNKEFEQRRYSYLLNEIRAIQRLQRDVAESEGEEYDPLEEPTRGLRLDAQLAANWRNEFIERYNDEP